MPGYESPNITVLPRERWFGRRLWLTDNTGLDNKVLQYLVDNRIHSRSCKLNHHANIYLKCVTEIRRQRYLCNFLHHRCALDGEHHRSFASSRIAANYSGLLSLVTCPFHVVHHLSSSGLPRYERYISTAKRQLTAGLTV
jgi:hypothetical protein